MLEGPGTGGDAEDPFTIGALLPPFVDYCMYERQFARYTVRNYRTYLRQVIQVIGDIDPATLGPQHVLRLKEAAMLRGVAPKGVLFALRAFLTYCRSRGITTIEPKQIRCPRPPRREVSFLTREEIREFTESIALQDASGRVSVQWLGFRALVEVLLGTGLRLSEALSLKRSRIDFGRREAQVIGKGNKERCVFFNRRSLRWLKEYFSRRQDGSDHAFVLGETGKALSRDTAEAYFRRVQQRTSFPKKVTAHVLRHTVATTLLFNGCPLSHIKEILGHERLETTVHYYIGTDKTAAQKAFLQHLRY